MLKKELFSICTLYAISPIHAGSGASTSVVDLPIQRERHTNWPHIQASAVKGAIRAHYRKFVDNEDKYLTNLIFGIDKDNDGDVVNKDGIPLNEQGAPIKDEKDKKLSTLPGALSVSDAKLLVFPVRSNIAPFVWVTCPSVLKRLSNDLAFVQIAQIDNIPELNQEEAIVLHGIASGKVILEDALVIVKEAAIKPQLPSWLSHAEKLILVSDEMFDYFVSSCTEIQTQIKIDAEKGTAQEGALRYQELLPSDTMLYSIVYYSNAGMNELQAATIKGHIENVVKDFIQIGGDETLGRGICKIFWINGGAR